MNVGQLKKMLQDYPEDMEIIASRMSDYELISETDWSIIKGVDKDGWIMRSHPTMSEDNKLKEKSYLRLF